MLVGFWWFHLIVNNRVVDFHFSSNRVGSRENLFGVVIADVFLFVQCFILYGIAVVIVVVFVGSCRVQKHLVEKKIIFLVYIIPLILLQRTSKMQLTKKKLNVNNGSLTKL